MDDLTAEVLLDQLQSACPRVVREIPPLFLMPGLAGRYCPEMKQMIEKIMYPVHCVRYNTEAKTLADIANGVIKVRKVLFVYCVYFFFQCLIYVSPSIKKSWKCCE